MAKHANVSSRSSSSRYSSMENERAFEGDGEQQAASADGFECRTHTECHQYGQHASGSAGATLQSFCVLQANARSSPTSVAASANVADGRWSGNEWRLAREFTIFIGARACRYVGDGVNHCGPPAATTTQCGGYVCDSNADCRDVSWRRRCEAVAAARCKSRALAGDVHMPHRLLRQRSLLHAARNAPRRRNARWDEQICGKQRRCSPIVDAMCRGDSECGEGARCTFDPRLSYYRCEQRVANIESAPRESTTVDLLLNALARLL